MFSLTQICQFSRIMGCKPSRKLCTEVTGWYLFVKLSNCHQLRAEVNVFNKVKSIIKKHQTFRLLPSFFPHSLDFNVTVARWRMVEGAAKWKQHGGRQEEMQAFTNVGKRNHPNNQSRTNEPLIAALRSCKRTQKHTDLSTVEPINCCNENKELRLFLEGGVGFWCVCVCGVGWAIQINVWMCSELQQMNSYVDTNTHTHSRGSHYSFRPLTLQPLFRLVYVCRFVCLCVWPAKQKHSKIRL